MASSIRYVGEEHTVVELEGGRSMKVGQQVEVVPSYCPVTVNLHDAYLVVDDDVVVDVWPLVARGPGWSSGDVIR